MIKIYQRIFVCLHPKSLILTGLLVLTLAACSHQVPKETLIQDLSTPEISSLSENKVPTDNPIILDLQEANVISVSFEVLEDGSYRFDVTLQHDDEGEAPDYADFWQVEDLAGDVLGKRLLTHSHRNEPFTRSETILIPAGVNRVIVRGHDMNHGFGGLAMEVDLKSGETEAFTESDFIE